MARLHHPVRLHCISCLLAMMIGGCVKEEVRDMARVSAAMTAQTEAGRDFAKYSETITKFRKDPLRDGAMQAAAGDDGRTGFDQQERRQVSDWIVDAHLILSNYYTALAALANDSDFETTDALTKAEAGLARFPPSKQIIASISADQHAAIRTVASLVVSLLSDACKNATLKDVVIRHHAAVITYITAMERLVGVYECQLALQKDEIAHYYRLIGLQTKVLDDIPDATGGDAGRDLLVQLKPKAYEALVGIRLLAADQQAWDLREWEVRQDRVRAMRAGYAKLKAAEDALYAYAQAGFSTQAGQAVASLRARSQELKNAYDAIRKTW